MRGIRQEMDFFLTEDLSSLAMPLVIITVGIFVQLLPEFVSQR